jgi:hypothetical protein
MLRDRIEPSTKLWPLAADKPPMSSIDSSVPSALQSSALSSGLATIAAGGRQLSQDAEQIANPQSEIPVAPLADLNQASLLAQAGADVVRSSDRMIGTLLDMFA